MDPILGQIILWATPWIPRGWAICNGTLLSIQQNVALFSLIGTTYGGDGVNTFALPDLRNRVPVGSQSPVNVGITSGAATASTTATVTLAASQLPPHTHAVTAAGNGKLSVAVPANAGAAADTNAPANGLVLGKGTAGNFPTKIYGATAADTTLKPFDVDLPVLTAQASGTPAVPVSIPVTVSTLQPGVTLNFIIATEGIYPSRN
ncbi:phage tail protein [Paracidovorax cattleyae]|uniref:Microcystin-dependent protein n=1 Tax=Paracidovorax cattleyae TaxID=80868 RepID=A0A1H0MR72_9BURK|nr:tail fiber protein [Paracidovorax cattleyae]AVS76538.1 phage tail protein [Paracidovorax cattleyae]MBF9263880.1 tail fiber protein [Paracidovorax cattleyae]SDO82901.1 Microcystin-dependent protein [Paracidovorax cattleyae]